MEAGATCSIGNGIHCAAGQGAVSLEVAVERGGSMVKEATAQNGGDR
jgi:hypothetical protein